MMNTILKDMSTAGFSKLMLWVFEDNTRARRFYEAHGFTTNGKTKFSMLFPFNQLLSNTRIPQLRSYIYFEYIRNPRISTKLSEDSRIFNPVSNHHL